MELIWVLWAVFGLIVGVLIGGMVKRERNEYNDSISDNHDNAGECDGMDRYIPTKEEINAVLYICRIGASPFEKKVLDYLIEREDSNEEE